MPDETRSSTITDTHAGETSAVEREGEAPRSPAARQMIVQIDGLSRHRLDRGIEQGLMPGLAALVSDGGFQLRSMYSGVPSTTPAVQAELMYGAKQAVPGFAYFDRERGVPRHLLDPVTADDAQRRIATCGEALLHRGAAYCDMYTGGATGGRFCVSDFAEPRRVLARGPIEHARIIGGLLGVGVRTAYMVAVEIKREAKQGSLPRGRKFGKRLHDLWERSLSCVALRDNSRLGARNDLRHGVPLVHINFIGYDKLAHQYGPDSRAAMAALEGIDRAIETLADAAREEGAELIVYSDHGQDATRPVAEHHDGGFAVIVRRAVAQAAEKLAADGEAPDVADASSEHRRLRRRGETPLREAISQNIGEHLLGLSATHCAYGVLDAVAVESGPIAHIYLRRRDTHDEHRTDATRSEQREMGSDVWRRADVPDTRAFAEAFTELLPGTAAMFDVNGEAHLVTHETNARGVTEIAAALTAPNPFADRTAADVAELTRHELAGDVVLFGVGFGAAWSFAGEAGSHGGAGPEETYAFAIVPSHYPADRYAGAPPATDPDDANAIDIAALRAMLLAAQCKSHDDIGSVRDDQTHGHDSETDASDDPPPPKRVEADEHAGARAESEGRHA